MLAPSDITALPPPLASLSRVAVPSMAGPDPKLALDGWSRPQRTGKSKFRHLFFRTCHLRRFPVGCAACSCETGEAANPRIIFASVPRSGNGWMVSDDTQL